MKYNKKYFIILIINIIIYTLLLKYAGLIVGLGIILAWINTDVDYVNLKLDHKLKNKFKIEKEEIE